MTKMRIFPLGDSAVTIEFGNEISLEANARAIALARKLIEDAFIGFVEAVPAYASSTVFFNSRLTSFALVRTELEGLLTNLELGTPELSRIVEIPMTVSTGDSPDLDRIAKLCGVNAKDVVDIFISRTYRVYMVGFLPGFAYMGEVDGRIAAPRLETPRTNLPAGSIGIAGKQTGIYPLGSPGGWNIIGRTDLQMFDPASDTPCLLRPGDEVRFVRR